MSRSISGANHDRKNEVFEVAFDGKQEDKKLPVSMRLGETPVPIPNTMVKT